jgi:methionyl aminopeptidase
MVNIKSEREIKFMRDTCRLAAETLREAGRLVKAGISTEDINVFVHDYIISHGAIPSPLNYHGFPKSVCTSVNHVICHGIPSSKVILKDGDIINIDVTTYFQNFHGDTSATYYVGEVSSKVKHLVEITYECLMIGIKEVKPGARLGNIGEAISSLAHQHNYSVVEDYCGHGIGRAFHEDPQVVHFGKRGTGIEIKPGMTFTIEPMINEGKKNTKLLKDGWTVETVDKKLSAQFEHTLLVTDNGVEILTLPSGFSSHDVLNDLTLRPYL